MGNKLLLTILTPEKAVLTDKPVDFVAIPAYGGEMGVLPGHASTVVQLQEGVLRYKDAQKREIFAVLNGFAEVHKNKVLVLAEAAELAAELNEERACQAFQKAKETLARRSADLGLDEASAALRRAVVRLKVAEFRRKHR